MGPSARSRFTRAIKAAGDEVGIPFDFERIVRQPNTVNAHRLIAWAQDLDLKAADALIERLFRAYFVDGINIGDIDALARWRAMRVLTRRPRARGSLPTSGRTAIEAEERRARALGVTGVPFFVFNQRLAVSGAQPPEVLLEAIEQAETAKLRPSQPQQ